MLAANVPYRIARLASLFLTFAFGVIGFAMGINALVKSNNQKDLVKREAPLGAQVDVNTDDVFDVGCVVTAVCAALAVVSLASIALLLFTRGTGASSVPLSTRTLPLQGLLLSFLTIWLFASLVPMTDFVANREAKVTATLGGVQLQPSVIKAVEQSLGVTSVYHEIDYLRLAVILPWIAFLFGAISSILSLLAARR
ncbi:hypothetical protein OH77DRAFT_1378234, partial [Trametes cingulata]